MSFRVDAEFKALIPALSDDERQKLEESLVRDGCRDPLVIWNDILLDGHNRYEICRNLGIAFHTKILKLPDRLAARIWIRWNQLGRRNLTDDQRAMQVAGLTEDVAKQSKHERASKAGKVGGVSRPKKNSSVDDASTKLKTERIRTKASKRARVSERKVKQAQYVRNKDKGLAAKIDQGELSLADAVRELKREEVKSKLENIETRQTKKAEGVFDVIVIDPPWPMDKIERDERERQVEFDYPRMTEDELKQEKLPCAPDAHVWLWTTHRFLPMAFRLLEIWGLKYVCTFVWHKPGGFQPIGLPQYNCEFALYARNGSPKFVDTKAFPVCFDAGRGAHSEKPEEFYEIVRRVTAGRRLDMFNRREIDGFETSGKEAA